MAKESPKANVPAVPAEAAAEAPKKSSRLKKIVIIVAILLIILSGAGGGAYWWLYLRVPPTPGSDSAAQAESAAQQSRESTPRMERVSELPRSAGKVLPLPQFVVNLADPAGRRLLRLGMEVEANADISKEIQANDAKIRDAVIMLLAGKTVAEVQSPEGKVLLRAEVAARLNQILGAPRIVRVYFTEFIVE